MRWTAVSDAVPADTALIFAEGQYYIAVLIDAEAGAAFMDVHSSDPLPWPTHWAELPPPRG